MGRSRRAGKETPDSWNVPRQYPVPAALTTGGRITIAVRVFDHYGGGGFSGSAYQMRLAVDGRSAVTLAGTWKCAVELELDPGSIPGFSNPATPQRPETTFEHYRPTVLFNGMIRPLAPYGIRGAIWYQGESNVGRADQYCTLLPAMIRDWRTLFNQGNFPFGIVQIANYLAPDTIPAPQSVWAELREAQALIARDVSGAGLAVRIDIGDADDIHPRNKADVGYRLSRWALAQVYNKKMAYSGPVYKKFTIDKNKAIVSFDHAGDSLVVKGERPAGFAIAGQDSVFVWADARIAGKKIIVWSPKVSRPLAVRYGWADNPHCNLYNSDGLPAVPFRTDAWAGTDTPH